MDVLEATDILSKASLMEVLGESPFEDRAEQIRSTLREVHHQYLEGRLTGQHTGPEVDYELLEEVAYYLSGVATTPGRSQELSYQLRSHMLAVSALVFEYLGEVANRDEKPAPVLSADSEVYYLDACICNSLGLFEANSMALAERHLLRQDSLDALLRADSPKLPATGCRQVVYTWLARKMHLLWMSRPRIEQAVRNTWADLDSSLSEGTLSRFTYAETGYWLMLVGAVTSHARYFQFGKETHLRLAAAQFDKAVTEAKQQNNPPLAWLAHALRKCAEQMSTNSIWQRLGKVCPPRYLRQLATSSPSVVELWTSQIAALEATAEETLGGAQLTLDHGFLDPKVRRVVVGMPTSAGKTLLAELAIIRTLFASPNARTPVPQTTCIYVVPNLALANQVEAKLQNRLAPLGVRVTAILGGYDIAQLEDTLFANTRVAVVTPEKLDMLVRQDHAFVRNCGLFVFDEIHKVDSIGRGWTMEVVITWLKDFHPEARRAKMVFMSAAMPNYLEIQAWVEEQAPEEGVPPALSVHEPWQPTRQVKGYFQVDRADLIRQQEDPPLTRKWFGGHLTYVVDRSDLDAPLQIRRLTESKEVWRQRRKRKTGTLYSDKDRDSFGNMENAAEIAKRYLEAHLDPVLVFFMSRNDTRSFCKYLASSEDYSPHGLPARLQEEYGRFITYLRARLGGSHPLAEFAAKGIAYHHGWLPRDIRAEIEYAYAQRWIRVLAATTTLAEGVNFPIATFILANYESVIEAEHGHPVRWWCIEKKDFKNMIGRAGRAVHDTEGQIIFMVPAQPTSSGVPWKDYLFPRDNDPEQSILSSLARPDFDRGILQHILNSLDDPLVGEKALFVDPQDMSESYGSWARNVGDTVLRLQAFLLALMSRDILNPNDMETIQRFFGRTLFGVQKADSPVFRLVTRFAQRTGTRILEAEPVKERRDIYAKAGLGFTSCSRLYAMAEDLLQSASPALLSGVARLLTTSLVKDLGVRVLSLPEVRPMPVFIPHTRPKKAIDLSHGDILADWLVQGVPLQRITDEHFGNIADPADRAEACANYIRDAFEFKAPWALSALSIFVSDAAQRELGMVGFGATSLGQELSMLPAYAKFGVDNPASAFFSMLGVSVRKVSRLLGTQYNQQNPEHYLDFPRMLDWLLEIESEQVSAWFEDEDGGDTAGYVARLFRVIDSIRGREQTLEDMLPLQAPVAGWRYYQGPSLLKDLAVGDDLTLRPDPLNPWDSYAVEVLDRGNRKIGFIPRSLSRAVQIHIAAGLPLYCSVAEINPASESYPIRLELTTPEEL
jgi:hypothetical protein